MQTQNISGQPNIQWTLPNFKNLSKTNTTFKMKKILKNTQEEVVDLGYLLDNTSIKPETCQNVVEYIGKICQKSGKQFIDPDFIPSEQIVLGNQRNLKKKDVEDVCWKRPEEIWGKGGFKLFQENILPEDIIQGEIDNCYLLATLSSLALHPSRIKDLFVTQEINPFGVYGINLCIDGEWQVVIVDDYIPCNIQNNQPIFSRSRSSEIWVILLEKAWAKLNRFYDKIILGQPSEVLRDLTGSPTKSLSNQTSNNLWDTIIEGTHKNWVMCAFSESQESTTNQQGIVGLLGYSLISGHEFEVSENEHVKVVKLRNPWGSTEWNGDWSDNSSLWTEDLKQKCNFEQQKGDNGIFFMSFEDYKKQFNSTQICMVNDTFEYTIHKVEKPKPRKGVYFNLIVTKPSVYYISVNQQNERKFPLKDNYKYGSGIIYLGLQTEKGEYKFIASATDDKKEVWCSAYLVSGLYIGYAKVERTDNRGYDYNISAYGEEFVLFQSLEKSFVENFKEDVLLDMVTLQLLQGQIDMQIVKTYAYLGHQKCNKIVKIRDKGYGYIYYQNDSNKKLIEEIDLTECNGFKFVCSSRGKTQIRAEILPDYSQIYVIKRLNGELTPEIIKNCFKSSVFEKLTEEDIKKQQFIEENNYLLNIARNKGECTRKILDGEQIDIFTYELIHDDGALLLYVNDTENKILCETITFDLQGLTIENQISNRVDIRLEPGKKFTIHLNKTQHSSGFRYDSKYDIIGA